MKTYIHTCCVCQNSFVSSKSCAYFCSGECKSLYDKVKYQMKKAKRQPAPQSDNMKQYYAYCEKHGFVTYGKFQALKTANALKEQRRAKNEQQNVEQ